MNLKQYQIHADRCSSCYLCRAICPAGAVVVDETGNVTILQKKCTRCGLCKKVCKSKAISYRMRLRFE
ncbi:MAG: 4Fe-4S dicluster domain [Firmicutes bacterium]|nr:4Fe-4S dicluster domain [Bacillota bacterium]